MKDAEKYMKEKEKKFKKGIFTEKKKRGKEEKKISLI